MNELRFYTPKPHPPPSPSFHKNVNAISLSGLLVECGKKWKIVRKILPNSAEKSEIVRENAK